MKKNDLYCAETALSNKQFVSTFRKIAVENGFTIHNLETMDMKSSFNAHGIEIKEEFDLHMIQVCKPEKAAKSLSANPERAVLMPKFIMTFTDNTMTQIRFLRYNKKNIHTIVKDEVFPDSLAETYDQIISMIEKAIQQ